MIPNYDRDAKEKSGPNSRRTISFENRMNEVIVQLLELENWRGERVLALGVGKALAETAIIEALKVDPNKVTFVDKDLSDTKIMVGAEYVPSDLFIFVEEAARQNKRYDLILMLGLEFLFLDETDITLDAFARSLYSILNKNGVIFFSPNTNVFSNELKKVGLREIVEVMYRKEN